MIVGCAAALLVCLCAGMVGAMILADRYGMDARRWVVTAVPTPAELGEPIGGRAPALAQPVEQVTLTGKIAIPEGSSLSARELHVITNHGEAAVNERGAFVTQAVRGDQATTLVIAANAQGNGVFLRTSRGSQTLAETEMSARSTARALVLYDLAILTLPAEYADRAESLVESLPDFARLVAAVEDAIRADPDDPLGVEAHEDLYRLAARLTQALLEQMQEPGGMGRSHVLADLNRAGKPLPAENSCSEDERAYVRVEDDLHNQSPQVTLVNLSFAYYDVGVRKDNEVWPAGATKETMLLPRSKAYQLLLSGNLWPPESGNSLPIRIDDGKLAFTFRMNEGLTMADLILTVWANIWGLPAANVSGLDAGTLTGLYGMKEFQQLTREFTVALQTTRGANFSDVAYAGAMALLKRSPFIALAGMHVYGAVVEGEAFQTLAVQYLGKKAVLALTVGYASADISGMIWSYAYAPRECRESGTQKFGRYPYETLLAVSPSQVTDSVVYEITFKAELTRPNKYVQTARFVWSLDVGAGQDLLMGEDETQLKSGQERFSVSRSISFPESKIPFAKGASYTVRVRAYDSATALAGIPLDEAAASINFKGASMSVVPRRTVACLCENGNPLPLDPGLGCTSLMMPPMNDDGSWQECYNACLDRCGCDLMTDLSCACDCVFGK